MRVLHIVKTADGARWAAQQAEVLTANGVDIHVALPTMEGEALPYWHAAGATIHIINFALPISHPHQWKQRATAIRAFVDKLKPDIIHSHFVTTSMMLRLALGKEHATPRVFQVPGPLHLEHPLFRQAEITTASKQDCWIASSRYIQQRYLQSGISQDRLYLSYYGNKLKTVTPPSAINVRKEFNIPASHKLIGNVSYMYPPKHYLGQIKGLKRHEDIIDALHIVNQQQADITGVLVGGQWGGGNSYEKRLHKRADSKTSQSVYFTGRVAPQESAAWWSEFDCAVHVPSSENCGGVLEPLLYDVPVIASKIGGLPEVILDGLTGWLVPVDNPKAIAKTIEIVLNQPEEGRRRAKLGHQLVSHMFNVERTGKEILEIYRHLLDQRNELPPQFDSQIYANHLAHTHSPSPL